MRKHLTYANVMSTLAALFALTGGVAYAANTVFSSDIVDGEVKEADIATSAVREAEIGQGAVATSELKNDVVTSAKVLNETLVGGDVKDNALKGADIDESTLSSIGGGGPAGGDLTGTYPNPEIRADSLTGADIDESTLALGGFSEAAGTSGGGCTADSGTLTLCASTTITVDRPGRVLVNATGEWHTFALDDTAGANSGTDLADRVRGRCQLQVDGVQIGSAQVVGERVAAPGASNHPEGGTMALTGLSGSVAAGGRTVAVYCTEEDGDLDWAMTNLTAVLVAD